MSKRFLSVLMAAVMLISLSTGAFMVSADDYAGIYFDEDAAWSLRYEDTVAPSNSSIGSDEDNEDNPTFIVKGANGNLPVDAEQSYNGKPSIELTVSGSSWWICGIGVGGVLDLDDYSGKYLQFSLKGQQIGSQFNAGFRWLDSYNNSGNKVYSVTTTQDWQVVVFEIDDFIDALGVNADKVVSFYVQVGSSQNFTAWIADVKIVDEPVEIPDPNRIYSDSDAEWALEYSDAAAPPATSIIGSDEDNATSIVKGDNGNLPVDAVQPYNGKPSINLTVSGASWWICGIGVGGVMDLNDYEGKYLQFSLKGQQAGTQFDAGFRWRDGGSSGAKCNQVTTTTNWQKLAFKIDDFIDALGDKAGKVESFYIQVNGSQNFTAWIADVKIVDKPDGIYSDPDAEWALKYNGTGSTAGIHKETGFEFENGAIPLDRDHKYNGQPSILYNITSTDFEWWFSGYSDSIDMTGYSDCILEAKVKGAAGGERFNIGFEVTKTDYSGVSNVTMEVTAGTAGEWTTIRIPMSALMAKNTGVNYALTNKLVVTFGTNAPVTFRLADVKIVRQAVWTGDAFTVSPLSGDQPGENTLPIDVTACPDNGAVFVTAEKVAGLTLKSNLLEWSADNGATWSPLYQRKGSVVYENFVDSAIENPVSENEFESETPVWWFKKLADMDTVIIKAVYVETDKMDSSDYLSIFGVSIRKPQGEYTAGLQFGARAIRSRGADELKAMGTLLIRSDYLTDNPCGDGDWSQWVNDHAEDLGESGTWRNVRAQKLMDRCDDYIDWTVRIIDIPEAGYSTEYVAVAWASYYSGEQYETLFSEYKAARYSEYS